MSVLTLITVFFAFCAPDQVQAGLMRGLPNIKKHTADISVQSLLVGIDMRLLLSNKLLLATKSVAILVLSLIGECAMSADVELKWEWPADREIEDRIFIKVDNVKTHSSGLFGLKKSPSFASNIPEPTVITGVIQNNDTLINGKSLKVVTPKPEIGEIKTGSYAVLGVVNKDICICVIPVDSADVDITKVNCP